MKAIELLAVGIRIFGVLLFFVTLRDTPNWIASINSISQSVGEYSRIVYLQYVVMAAFFAASFFMAKFPITLSRMLFSSTSSDSPLLEENGEAIQLAGITIVGVYILTRAIPDLCSSAILFWMIKSGGQIVSIMETKIGNSLVVSIIEVVLGFYCLLGARGIIKAVKMLRG